MANWRYTGKYLQIQKKPEHHLTLFCQGADAKLAAKQGFVRVGKRRESAGQVVAAGFAQIIATLGQAHHTQTYLQVNFFKNEDIYVDNSEDDLAEWQQEQMDNDEELCTLMEFVFGSDSEDD